MRLKRDRERLDRLALGSLIALVIAVGLAVIGSDIASPFLTQASGVVGLVLLMGLIAGLPFAAIRWEVDQPKLGLIWTDKQRLWLTELDEQEKMTLIAQLAQANRISLADLGEFTQRIAAVLQNVEQHNLFPPLEARWKKRPQ